MAGRIVVLNLGTTSFKFKLFDFDNDEELLASGGVERISEELSDWNFQAGNNQFHGKLSCRNHEAAFGMAVEWLEKQKIISSLNELSVIGFKAVHGGALIGAQEVDEKLIETMEAYAAFAPAHNPMYIQLMRRLLTAYPELKQVACFETSFHSAIPLRRAVYGVPREWMEKYGIRRYGFHGSSHSYIAMKMRELSPESKKIISLHLGGSSSVCAISDGESIATSMGATPQSGLFQNNRVGDFDTFCLPKLKEVFGCSDAVMEQLSGNSGFLGLSGVSNDLRDILDAVEKGNKDARLAIDAFADNCVGYIGMFIAYLRGIDAIVFTGGIGQHCAVLRNMICSQLDYLGIKIDSDVCNGLISTPDTDIEVWILETNEELMVARQTNELLEK